VVKIVNCLLNSKAYECHHKGTKITKDAQRATEIIESVKIRVLNGKPISSPPTLNSEELKKRAKNEEEETLSPIVICASASSQAFSLRWY
jgi:hypothetical protein